MDWWHKMRRAWVALSLRSKPATCSKSDCAGGGGGGDAGLLKLQDEVQVCGYKDVEVMWSMLYKSSQQAVQNPKRRKQQGHAWRALFFTNSKQDTTTASSVSSCFMFGFNSY